MTRQCIVYGIFLKIRPKSTVFSIRKKIRPKSTVYIIMMKFRRSKFRVCYTRAKNYAKSYSV